MFSGKLSQCISEPCFTVSSDKKTADLAFWGAVSCALCSCWSCQGLAKLQTATRPNQELPVLLGCLLRVAPHWWLLGFARELLDQATFGPLGCCPQDPALGGTSSKTWEGGCDSLYCTWAQLIPLPLGYPGLHIMMADFYVYSCHGGLIQRR